AGRSDPAAAEAASNPLAEMQRQIDQGNVQAPEDVAAWIGATPRGTSGRRGRHRGSGMRAAGADSAGTPPSPLPSRTLRRRPYDHEIAAAVDYAAMDSAYQSALDLLVMEVRQLQRYQVDELHDAIVEAAGDMGVLSEIAATPQHRDVIQARLVQVATLAAEQHVGEAQRQGTSITRPAIDTITAGLTNRSEA